MGPGAMRRQFEVGALAEKRRILKQAGFRYSFDRDVYYNSGTKKVFSIEFIEDHSADDLNRLIQQDANGKSWHFFFNSPPSSSVKRTLEGLLG